MRKISWQVDELLLELEVEEQEPVRVRGWGPRVSQLATRPDLRPAGPGVPLVEVDCLGAGRLGNSASAQHRPYAAGLALRYLGHEVSATPDGERLVVRQQAQLSGLSVISDLQNFTGTGVTRIEHELVNTGREPVVLSYVSTLSLSGFTGGTGFADSVVLHEARNAWCAELRWQRRTPEEAGIVDNGEGRRGDEGVATSRARHTVTAAGSWSTGGSLPIGALEVSREGGPGCCWTWQVEHSGSWHWEIADLYQDLYVQVSGPTDAEHQWRCELGPGQRFRTVAVALAIGSGGLEDGLRQLTAYRRLIRRRSPDHSRLPVIFNDYMNCLWGNPTQQRLEPLIEAAAAVGCEYFVIDAGWYAELDRGWWDTVGQWEPSPERFPDGLPATLERIRAAGMVPGLWLEPEVIGVRSPLAGQLPEGAFFELGGQRVAEHGRYHLDLRHPAALDHLDRVIDRVVGDWGVGYLKLDYNISLRGTDGAVPGAAPGAGLLEHNRAYLAWMDGVLDRYPKLVIENCASGGMRMDYGLLARAQLQSTSDQSDFRRYAAIAAAAPSAVTPEQAAVWAYPLPGQSEEEVSFTLVNAMLGRIHLSGLLDEMSSGHRQRITAALRAYRENRGLLAAGLPHWPLGLPGWYDERVALAISGEREILVAVWWRGDGPAQLRIPLGWLNPAGWHAQVLFPADLPTELVWTPAERELLVGLPVGPAARLIRLRR